MARGRWDEYVPQLAWCSVQKPFSTGITGLTRSLSQFARACHRGDQGTAPVPVHELTWGGTIGECPPFSRRQ